MIKEESGYNPTNGSGSPPTQLAKSSSLLPTPTMNMNNNPKEQQQQNDRDRTLFCINIDEKCSEDILYELFLQAGPIDNIVRKTDRNGKYICLVTYKHIESCDFAIKLFNGVTLFNQNLRVQLSQSGGPGQLTPRNSSANLSQSSGNLQLLASSNSSSNLNASANNNNMNRSTPQQSPFIPPLMSQQQQQQFINMVSQSGGMVSPNILMNLNSLLQQSPAFSAANQQMNMQSPYDGNSNGAQLNRTLSGSRLSNMNNSNNYQDTPKHHHHQHHHGSHQGQHQHQHRRDYDRRQGNGGGGHSASRQNSDYRGNNNDYNRNNSYSNSRDYHKSRSRSPQFNKRK